MNINNFFKKRTALLTKKGHTENSYIYDTKTFRSLSSQDKYLIRRGSDDATMTVTLDDITGGEYATWLAGATGYIVEWYNTEENAVILERNNSNITQMILTTDGVVDDYAENTSLRALNFAHSLLNTDVIFNFVFKNITTPAYRTSLVVSGNTSGKYGVGELFSLLFYSNKCWLKWVSRADSASDSSFACLHNNNEIQTLSFLYSGNVVSKAILNGVEQTLGAGNGTGHQAIAVSSVIVLGTLQDQPYSAGMIGKISHFSILHNTTEDLLKVNQELTAIYNP